MSIIIFVVVFSLLLYWTYFKPGAVLAFVVFFQYLNKYLFDGVGLTEFRYVSTGAFIILLFIFHYKTKVFIANLYGLIRHKVFWAYIILATYMYVYAYISESSIGMSHAIQFIVPGIVLVFLSGTFFFKTKMFQEFIVGIIVFTFILFVAIIGNHGIGVFTLDRGLISETLGFNSILLGRVATLGFFLVLILILEKKVSNLLGLIVMLFFGICMGFAGTRGALFAGLFALIIYLILNSSLRKVLRMMKYTVVFIPLLFLFDFSNFALFERTELLFEDDYVVNMRRYLRYPIFFEALPNYYLLGAGPQGWFETIMPGDVYPHNLIVELIIEYGLIGGAVFILIIISVIQIIKSTNFKYTSTYMKLFVVSWVYVFTASMFSGSILHNTGVFYFLIIMGCFQIQQRKLCKIN